MSRCAMNAVLITAALLCIGFVIVYSIYFSQNCLKSHTYYTESYNYHCWSRYKSVCMNWAVTTTEDPHVVCDEWKKND